MHERKLGTGSIRIELELSDPAETIRLRDRLAAIPGIEEAELVPGTPGPGQLGVVDILTILAGSSSVLAVALKMLPETIRAARESLTIHIRSGDREITLTAANADDAVKLLGLEDGDGDLCLGSGQSGGGAGRRLELSASRPCSRRREQFQEDGRAADQRSVRVAGRRGTRA
jgi:hypothetical protein